MEKEKKKLTPDVPQQPVDKVGGLVPEAAALPVEEATHLGPPTVKARNRTNTLLTLADGAAFPRNRTMEIPEEDFKRFSTLGWVVAV